MPTTDPRVDEYIESAPEYAQPILTHLRELVHAGCPDIVETMKWSRPAFEYHGIVCGMAAFKSYVMFGFWKASLIKDQKTGKSLDVSAEGSFGRITKLSDLPARRTLLAYIKEACRLNEEGVKATPMRKTKTAPRPPLAAPPYLAAALKKNKKAATGFEKFSPSHRREYIEWLTEAKTEATREKRLATAVEWMAEGKPRNWKYMPTRQG